MKNGPKYTYTVEGKATTPVNEIKSNPNFATPGTGFEATDPNKSNQPKRTTVGDRAKESVKKAVKFIGDFENTDDINLICPTNNYSSLFYSSSKNYLFLLKYNELGRKLWLKFHFMVLGLM